jgi:hypothetical protein
MDTCLEPRNVDSQLLGEYDLPPARFLEVVKKEPKSDEEQAADAMAVPLWGRLLIKTLKWSAGVIVLAFGVVFLQFYSLKGDIARIEGKLDEIPVAVAQKLIDQAKAYVDRGNTAEASRDLALATSFLEDAKRNKVPANTEFFEDTYVKLNQLKNVPQLSDEWQVAREQLASYRSVLQSPPKLTGSERRANAPISPDEVKGATHLVMMAPGDFIFLDQTVKKLSDNITIQRLVLVGGVDGVRQTLDGIRWIDDVFVNVQIRYEGGEVMLENVKFVNCTFDIANDPNGAKVTDYAIVGKPPSVVIGLEKASLSRHDLSK